jgi:hypothetical protein
MYAGTYLSGGAEAYLAEFAFSLAGTYLSPGGKATDLDSHFLLTPVYLFLRWGRCLDFTLLAGTYLIVMRFSILE